MELGKIEEKYTRVDWNSMFLLLLLIVPASIMVLVLFLWPDVFWFAQIPLTAIEIFGSFAAILLSIFVIARYREQSGILYISAGLMSMGIIEGLQVIAIPRSTEFVWLHSLAGIFGGVFFALYALTATRRLPIPSVKVSAKGVGLLLGSTAIVAFSFAVLSIVFSGRLPVMVQEGLFTPVAWMMNAIPVVLFLFAGISLFRQYRKTGARELFLFTAMLIFLFQASEIYYFASSWGIIWWLWQTLRFMAYFGVLGFVLRGYMQTSESLAVEVEERKKVEESLREADDDWRDSFNSLEEVMLIIDKDCNIEKVNNSGLVLLGKSREDLTGRKYYEVVHGEDKPPEYCPFGLTLKTRKVVSVEHYDEASGKHFSLTSAPIFDEHGEVIRCVYLMRDITSEVKTKEKERELQQELTLTSRLASIGEVAAGIAHEINNPLTGVIGFAQMMSQMDIPADVKEAVEVINDGATRTAGIVEKLLTFARRNRPGKEYADINSIVDSTVEIRSYEMRTNNIEVTTELASDLPRTMVNVGQLQQVFLNIIINAEQAMVAAHEGGELTVRTETVNGSIRVSLADDGPGIAKDSIGKIFDPFFTTKGEEGGTGLGLSVSYGIIKEHGGKISAKSTPGKGATFAVELPVVAESKQAEIAEPAEREPEKAGGAKIMVVDDEINICRVLDRLLSREGHWVDSVTDAESALQRLRSSKYDLILLDLKMPGMSGIELYKHMKEIDPSLQQKVVCITGDAISPKHKAFLTKGRIPYIVKPFSVAELLHQVKSGLGGKRDNAQATYSYR